jgi:hypothetical protein
MKEGKMGEIVYTSRIKIVREKGPTRRAMIEGFNEPIFYGVHGGKVGEAREAFSQYLRFCPAAQSVIGCINIRDDIVLRELRE